MDGLPIKRTASVPHECSKCGLKIKRHDECFSIPQRNTLSRKFFTQYLCMDCGKKHIARIITEAKRTLRMFEAAK